MLKRLALDALYAALAMYGLLSISYMVVTQTALFEPQGAFIPIKLAASAVAGVGNALATAIRLRSLKTDGDQP